MKKNVASLRVVKFPTVFDIVSNKEFYDYVNCNPDLTGTPIMGTVIDNNLKVYPIPDTDDDQIELLAHLKSSVSDISKTQEPELPELYDKCLEYFATSQFLTGKERDQYLRDYKVTLADVRPLEQRKFHDLSRKPIEGFLT